MDGFFYSHTDIWARIRRCAEPTFGGLLLGSALSYVHLSQEDKYWSAISLAIFFISVGSFNILQFPKIVLYGHYTLLITIVVMVPIMTLGRTTVEEHTRFLPLYVMLLTFLTAAWPSILTGLRCSSGMRSNADIIRPRDLPRWYHAPSYYIDIESDPDLLPLAIVQNTSTNSLLGPQTREEAQSNQDFQQADMSQPDETLQPAQDREPDVNGHQPASNLEPVADSQPRPISPASSSNMAAPGARSRSEQGIPQHSAALRVTEIMCMGPSSVCSQESHTDTSISLGSAASLPSRMSDDAVVFFQDEVHTRGRPPHTTKRREYIANLQRRPEEAEARAAELPSNLPRASRTF